MPRTPKSSGRYVALLRGINVGGKNKLPMNDLAEVFGEIRCTEVKTYIQSGNVVFSSPPDVAETIPAVLTRRITERFRLTVPVVLRSAGDLAAIVEANPHLAAGADPGTLHVMFLADQPKPAQVAKLDPDRSPPDTYVVRGSEIFLRCPNGFGVSKLTNAYFDSKLDTTSTVRNWRTVCTLLEMATS